MDEIIPAGMHRFTLQEFKLHLFSHCAEAVSELREKVNVNQFWQDLISAIASDIFGQTASDRRRLFKIAVDTKGPFAAVPDYQMAAGEEQSEKRWVSKLLYLQLEAVLNMMRAWKRQMGIMVQLDINDLRAQMRTRPYWVACPHKDGHKQRFEGMKGNKRCICIRLDFHEMGYQAADRETWEASLHPDGDPAVFVERAEWIDPRLGDLFEVEDATLGKREKGQDA